MKYHRLSLAVLAVAACTALPASAQFGSMLASIKPSPVAAESTSSAGNLDQDLKVFSDKSSTIEGTLARALEVIGLAYASEEKRAKLVAERESLAKATDPKEISAKRAEHMQSAKASFEQAVASQDLGEKTKAMSEAKKQSLAKAVTLYLSGAMQAKDLVPSGQALLSSGASNPMNLGKLAGVKDSLPRLGNAVAYAGESIPALVKVLRGANVKVVEPKSSSEKVADITEADVANS